MVLHERAFARFSTEVWKFKAVDQRLALRTQCCVTMQWQWQTPEKTSPLKNTVWRHSAIKDNCLQHPRTIKDFWRLMANMEYHFTNLLYILMLFPCWIAETFSGSGSDVTLVWPSSIVCLELFPERLICVSSPNAANLLATSFRSPRYCAYIWYWKAHSSWQSTGSFLRNSNRFKLHDAITRSSGRIFYFFSLRLFF